MTTPHRASPRGKLVPVIAAAVLSGVVCFWIGRRSAANLSTSSGSGASRAGTLDVKASSSPTLATIADDGQRGAEWKSLQQTPASQKRNEALAAFLERLAGNDPRGALELARAEPNLRLKEQLVAAALRGWARHSAVDAANWVLQLPELNARTNFMRAVFSGAVDSPEEALRLGRTILERDPEGATDHGMALIGCLVDAGRGDLAEQFALKAQPSKEVWVMEAYARWSIFQPELASRAAMGLPEGEARIDALRGVANGWGEANPGQLSQFLAEMPTSGIRRELLGHALRQWVVLDPIAASKWINSTELGPDMDEGVAAVATMQSLKPEIAREWAESIESPQLRSETLAAVLREWGTKDPKGASAFLAATKDLQPQERQAITDFFRNQLNLQNP
ncbi:MAG: hypothetical protein QM790_18020 [Nibricoccus sp.]